MYIPLQNLIHFCFYSKSEQKNAQACITFTEGNNGQTISRYQKESALQMSNKKEKNTHTYSMYIVYYSELVMRTTTWHKITKRQFIKIIHNIFHLLIFHFSSIFPFLQFWSPPLKWPEKPVVLLSMPASWFVEFFYKHPLNNGLGYFICYRELGWWWNSYYRQRAPVSQVWKFCLLNWFNIYQCAFQGRRLLH